MALGKRSGVISAKEQRLKSSKGGANSSAVIGDDGDSKIAFGTGTPELKKFGQHVGAEAHAGDVPHAGERLQGNVGDHPHYADQPDTM